MKLLTVVALLGLLEFSVPAVATADPNWSSYGFITEISHANPHSGATYNGLWITYDAAVYNDNCPTSPPPAVYWLPDEAYSPSNNSYKTDLALVMAAYMNQRPVAFYIKGCYNGSNPIVGGVRVQ